MGRFNKDVDDGMRLLGKSAGFGWRIGAAIGGNIYQRRVAAALESERKRQEKMAAIERDEEAASKARISKYDKILQERLSDDLD